MVKTPKIPPHLEGLTSNGNEVLRLVTIHETMSGKKPGRRHDVEILNKSAVVLLVACWEAFVEDMATNAFGHLLDKATSPTLIPNKVLAGASRDLRQSQDETALWTLAGDGWKGHLK